MRYLTLGIKQDEIQLTSRYFCNGYATVDTLYHSFLCYDSATYQV